MRKKNITIISIFLLCLILSPFCLQATSKIPKKIKGKYRTFLNEVGPIITPRESKAFYSLKNDGERDEFIQLFWSQRDPTPLTPENEFRQEYAQRLQYVERRFGREEGKPGWATERGRFYLILGAPKTIDQIDGSGKLYPTELWFYSLSPKYGVPPNFNLVFYKPYGTEFILYSPNHDGPQAIIGAFSGDIKDNYTAYKYIKMWAPELAPATISLIPTKRGQEEHTAPLENIQLIANITDMPRKQVNEDYVEMYYKLKYRVDVDISLQFTKSKTITFISPGRDKKMMFLNLVIQPEKFSIENYNNKYYTKLNIVFNLYDKKTDKKIFTFNKDQHMSFGQDMIKKISKKKINIALKYPLIPGKELKYLLYIKNYASNEFFMHESEINTPDPEEKPYIVDMVLANHYKTPSLYSINRSFQIGDRNIFPSVGKVFFSGDNPFVTLGVNNPTDKEIDVDISYYNEEEKTKVPVKTLKAKSSDISHLFINLASVIKKYGYKKLVAELRSDNILLDSKDYTILYSPLRNPHNTPFSIHVNFPELTPSNVYYYLGSQYFNLDEINKAGYYIDRSINMKKSTRAKILKVKLFYAKKQFSEGLRYLMSAISEDKLTDEVNYLKFIGYLKTGNLPEAEKTGDKLFNNYFVNVEFLNTMGNLCIKIGKLKKANLYFKRSLEIEGSQQKIKDRLNELK